MENTNDVYANQYQDAYYGEPGQYVQMPNATTNKIANMVTASAIIWICIAVYQLIVGFVLLLFGGIATIACGAWNIYACVNNFKHAKYVRNCSSPMQGRAIVEAYDKALTSNIIFLFINLFLGGGLGVVGAIFDLILRSYVLKNKNMLGA